MLLAAAGHPLHTRALSITLAEGEPPLTRFAASLLDLRKRGFAPVGGDLQGPGIIHHMQLDGVIDRAAGRIERVDVRMPAIAFEASPATGGESCRDQSGRVAALAGLRLDDGYAPAVGAEIGGPRGCSHVLTLAHLLAPTARWALAEDARLHGGVPARRAGERIFRRDVTVDGYETAPGALLLTAQLNDLHFAPAPPVAAPLARFAAQTELRAAASTEMPTMTLGELVVAERRRTAADLREAEWCDRSSAVAALGGASLRAGISARLLAHFADPAGDAPLRDMLLQLAPALIQCFAALDIWKLLAGDDSVATATGGLPDSCWMWRRGGGLGNR